MHYFLQFDGISNFTKTRKANAASGRLSFKRGYNQRLVFAVGRSRSVEVDFWRPDLRSILNDRPKMTFFRLFSWKKDPKIDEILREIVVKLHP